MTTTTGKQSLPASHGRNRVRRQPRDVAFDVVLYLICTILLILILPVLLILILVVHRRFYRMFGCLSKIFVKCR